MCKYTQELLQYINIYIYIFLNLKTNAATINNKTNTIYLFTLFLAILKRNIISCNNNNNNNNVNWLLKRLQKLRDNIGKERERVFNLLTKKKLFN